MNVTTLSSRDFNQDTGKAKKAAAQGPVFITDRGKPAHVLLSIADYRRLTQRSRRIADALAMPERADVAIEIPRLALRLRRADFR